MVLDKASQSLLVGTLRFNSLEAPQLGGSANLVIMTARRLLHGQAWWFVQWPRVATFYTVAYAGAILTFPLRVAGFDSFDFLALSIVHLFAALFAATFSRGGDASRAS